MHTEGDALISYIHDTITITNEELFSHFLSTFLYEDLIAIKLSNYMNATMSTPFGPLDIPYMPLNIVTYLSGMNGIKDVYINNFDLPRDRPEGGVYINIDTTLGNPTNTSVTLFDVTFDIIYKEKILGKVLSKNTTFYPGNNTLELSGYIDPRENLTVAGILVFIFNY